MLLDTHIWLWWLLGDGALKTTERHQLDRLAGGKQLAISWVSVWETEMLERKGRIHLEPNFEAWIAKAVHPGVCHVLPADVPVVAAQRRLPASFHADPADRLIAATSLLSGWPLVTRDRNIIRSGAVELYEL